MLIQNKNFFSLVGNLEQLKYMMTNILERHGNIHPYHNKDEYKHIKDANHYSAFPSLYDLKNMSGKTYIGKIESYLMFIKNNLEIEERVDKTCSHKMDETIVLLLKEVWKETKILMKKYELDYDFSEDLLGDI